MHFHWLVLLFPQPLVSYAFIEKSWSLALQLCNVQRNLTSGEVKFSEIRCKLKMEENRFLKIDFGSEEITRKKNISLSIKIHEFCGLNKRIRRISPLVIHDTNPILRIIFIVDKNWINKFKGGTVEKRLNKASIAYMEHQQSIVYCIIFTIFVLSSPAQFSIIQLRLKRQAKKNVVEFLKSRIIFCERRII